MHDIGYSIVGLGAVGRSLAQGMARAGYKPRTLVGANRIESRHLAKSLKATLVHDLKDIDPRSNLVVIAVPDNEISGVAKKISALSRNFVNVSFLHTSGSLSSEVLDPLARCGFGIASCHPYQSFPRTAKTVSLKGVTFGVDGNAKGVAAARKLVRALGGKVLLVPPQQRVLYHLSAVLASGFVGFDLLMAVRVLRKLGLSERRALEVILPITLGTIRNAKELGVKAAITGPAVRGDQKTVEQHLKALRENLPELEKVYREVSKGMGKV